MKAKTKKTADGSGEARQRVMQKIGRAAREAAAILANTSTEQKNRCLTLAAQSVRAREKKILEANAKDMEAAEALSDSKRDRLKLNPDRVEGIAKSLEDVAELPDPVGEIIKEWSRPNGLRIARQRTTLGVIGLIYESRPNVTADAGGLVLKAGSAAILRAGSESVHSSQAIHACLLEGLRGANLPESAVQMTPLGDRAVVGDMLEGLGGAIDVLVPRGGANLVARVLKEARIPVFGHLEGICHIYIEKSALLDMARDITLNAKMRRPGICGAAETLLMDRECLGTHLEPVLRALHEAGCALRGDETVQRETPPDLEVTPATEEDWSQEYLAPIISVKVVEGVEDAIAHIAHYGSGHTESIITQDAASASLFLEKVDSAIVMHNASTQYADGGEFGMGAEIGIATQKFHARGPVGLEQLTSFKYVVRGAGQCRPA